MNRKEKLEILENWYSVENQTQFLPYTNSKPNPTVMKKLGHKNIAEIGVRTGRNFKNMTKFNFNNAYAIDLWTDDGILSHNDIKLSQREMNSNYLKLKEYFKNNENVHLIKSLSVNASKQFEDCYFDLVFIDADHTYNGVWEDIVHWYPKVRSGGIVSGHDYIERKGKYGVIEAVNKYLDENKLDKSYLYITRKVNGSRGGGSIPSWYYIKP